MRGSANTAANLTATTTKLDALAKPLGTRIAKSTNGKKTAEERFQALGLLFDREHYEASHSKRLQQAEQKVLNEQLEVHRSAKTLDRLQQLTLAWKDTKRSSPFAFPLLVERLTLRMSNESLLERIQRIKQQKENK